VAADGGTCAPWRPVGRGHRRHATRASFEGAAELLVDTDFADACPIATIALEIASTDEPMRVAAAAAFELWLAVLEERFTAAGMEASGQARSPSNRHAIPEL
jgi:hypothetical protein